MTNRILVDVDPILFSLWGVNVHWYGLSYIVGIMIAMFVLKKIDRSSGWLKIDDKSYDSLFFHIVIGIVLGGRLGYVLLYNPVWYLNNPSDIYRTWNGGMSFHGGLIGVCLSAKLFCAKRKIWFSKLCDIAVVVVPIGLFFGRIANFINGELYGRVTDMPWGVVFPKVDEQLRHPSQLYEALGEGLILGVLMAHLWRSKKNQWDNGGLFGAFLILYGIIRIICEFFRVPDHHIGFIGSSFTEGQILCLPMIVFGLILLYKAGCRKKPATGSIGDNSDETATQT